ncbi:hypothetical protein MGYG_00300 [Nannizzia gypsea CBS 118893]|uniref:DEUBAD domain-containing protein n=1 Tax=Arthroderma gypseum (strain ATCC MYA-4604 / CBS 118893) TaxID=535722 RepID=E5QYS1_ARTGP|nr:hypothetical protein MGYG_00300 [Nannizzia gypsea CBS 118893]EFQ97259.1 hypothetical protein MGYG_00300 [Nannizzia gypsea CBS 118893]
MERKMPAKTTSTKRKSGRGTKKNPWADEDLVMTSEKSPLVDVDLAKLLAKPEAWACLDEGEKKEILALLPESVHPNAEPSAENPDGIIPPLSEEFLRYSNVWRDTTRQFQVDLQNGKYNPQWQKQAHKAMKERAEGKFDARKERDFEAFWGQKQRYHTNAPAGESATVDFKTLVTNGVFEVGDIWKYSRSQGKGADKFLVEKEVAVMSLDGETLTFAIPPGRRVFLPSSSKNQPATLPTPEHIPDCPVEPEPRPKSSPECEPTIKTECKVGSQVIPDTGMPGADSSKPHVCDEDRSIAQEYIASNSRNVLTENLEAESNQPPADESCITNKATVELAIPKDPSSLSTAMDVHPSDNVPPSTESQASKVLSYINQKSFVEQSFIDQLLDDGDDHSIVSDPPDIIDEIDDVDFHRSLQELGPSPPANIPYTPIPLQVHSSASRKGTSPAEPEVAVKELEAGNPDAPNRTQPGRSSIFVPKIPSLKAPILAETATAATETELQVPDVSGQTDTNQSHGRVFVQSEAGTDSDAQTKTETPNNWPETSSQLGAGSPGTLNMKPKEPSETLNKMNPSPMGKEEGFLGSPNSGEPVIFSGVTGPMFLIRKIHELDGRECSARIANAWMVFRCIRNNQDMGTLWDIRHSWYLRSKR